MELLPASQLETSLSVLAYFRHPFPSREGFSAYRMPGAAVHGPLILVCLIMGFFLCWPHPMLRPLLLVWMLAGLYLGRDVAILCHYNPLLTLVVWAASAFVFLRAVPIAAYGRSHVLIPAVVSCVLGALLVLIAVAVSRRYDA